MNNQEQKNSISDNVLDKIKSGDVKMKPKIYFILRMVLLILGVMFLFSFIIYLISFILFSLRASGLLFLPKFGFLGIGILFGSLPWFLIFLAAILIVILEIFTKHFTFIYRRPILYSLLTIIVIVIAVSFLIEKTPFHSSLFLSAREKHLPLIGPFYRNYGAPSLHNVHRGVVSEIIDNSFKIKTPRNETLTVVITSQTHLPPEKEIKEGDEVVVLGERNDDTVEALEIHQIEKDFDLFPPGQIPRDYPHFEQ